MGGRGGCGGGWGSGGWLEGDMGDGSYTIDSVFVILKVTRCEVSSLLQLLSHLGGNLKMREKKTGGA